MPFVYLLQASVIARNPGIPAAALTTTMFYMLLVMAAAFSLRTWRIVLAAAVGAAFEVRLSTLTGETSQVAAWSVPVIAGVAAVCIYTTRRTIRLVENVATEQRRRERLGRYFSPQVAARVEALGDGAAAGESREVTLLFSDLREFTALSETLASERVVPGYGGGMSSAKAALENFARSLALEYAVTGIRVNVVSPGNVAAGSSLKVFEEDPSYREFVLRVSLGRRNTPVSIADAFVFLCSPLGNEINGQVLSPDYGAGIGNRL